MTKFYDFLFGRNSDYLDNLEEDAEEDIELLRDVLFLHQQKMDAIRELFVIWQTGTNIDKIDRIGRWIKGYNEKLLVDINRILRIESVEESVIKLLIAKNEEFAGEFEIYDIGSLLKRMEGQLRTLRTLQLELKFIIQKQTGYFTESGKGIVSILKEIKKHEKFYLLIQDEIGLERKINRLVRMLEEEAVRLHKKEFKAKGAIVIEEVYTPHSREFAWLYKEVYIKYFPDPGELLALEDFKEGLEARYEGLERGYYHIFILKVGTTPAGAIMFDLSPINKTVCVGLIYYYFIEKELLVGVEEGNKAGRILMDAAINMLNRDARQAGYKQVSALIGEVDNPERKTKWKLKTNLKRAKLKRKDAPIITDLNN